MTEEQEERQVAFMRAWWLAEVEKGTLESPPFIVCGALSVCASCASAVCSLCGIGLQASEVDRKLIGHGTMGLCPRCALQHGYIKLTEEGPKPVG